MPRIARAQPVGHFGIRTHVALLRGINVGGHNRVAMADLRRVTAALGHTDVETYVQSGNVVFSSSGADAAELAGAMEVALEEMLHVRVRVVVLGGDELARVVADNPFSQGPSGPWSGSNGEFDPKHLHAGFRQGPFSVKEFQAMDVARAASKAKGSTDEVAVVGRTLYLRTPDGLGRSELATQLARARGPLSSAASTTMRNWTTVSKLLELLS